MNKLLITGGCSFSECIRYYNSAFSKNWPMHLAEIMPEYKHVSTALPSQGNGLISRQIIYAVSQALKTFEPKDLLVGVMWSGSNRHDFRIDDANDLSFVKNDINNHVYENPTQFVTGCDKNWAILNVNWTENNDEAKLYYKHFYSDVGHSIYSLEHILRTQYYLKSKGVPYFFTNYVDHNIIYPSNITSLELKHLVDELDLEYYLPVSSEFQWIVNNNIRLDEWDDHRWKQVITWTDDLGNVYKWNTWLHPTENQHKEFVNKIIVPWIKEKYAGIVFNG